MDKRPEDRPRNVFSFFCFGVLTIVFHEVLVASNRDILAGKHSISAAVAVLAAGLPQVVAKLTIPWIIQKIPHICKLVIVFVLFTCGLVMLVVSPDTTVRLAGLSIAELGTTMAEMTFLSQTTFYSHVTTSAFIAGMGVGSIVGPLYYTATAMWFCVAPRLAVAAILPGIVLFFVVYAAMDRSPLWDPWVRPPSHNGIKYELLAAAEETFENKLTWSRRCVIGWLISPLIIFLYWVYFADYLSNHAVVTNIAFRLAPFRAHDHYTYYTMCHGLGNFLGLSYLLIVSLTCSSQLKRVRINKIWILAVIGVLHNVLFVTMSWYRYLPQVGVIMALCFTAGFTTGAIYSNSPHVVRDQAADNSSQEFGLSLLTLGTSAGQLAGGLLGLYTEPALREHCLYALKLDVFCYTQLKRAGWLGSAHCSR